MPARSFCDAILLTLGLSPPPAIRVKQTRPMLVIPNTFFFSPSLQIWWPSEADSVTRFLREAPIVDVMQCSDNVAENLARFSFRRREFSTILIDLSRSTEELWSDLARKSCRNEISRARRIETQISNDSADEEVYRLVSTFARTYTRPPSRVEWERFASVGRVFSIRTQGQLIAAHMVLIDPPYRARLLFSATIDRTLDRWQGLIGPLNRLLHWSELEFFKEFGIRYFDFGGVTENQSSPLYPISRFKRSFGGVLVHENIVRLASHVWLRIPLSGASRARRMLLNVAASR